MRSEKSEALIREEGTYPELSGIWTGRLDNWTDSHSWPDALRHGTLLCCGLADLARDGKITAAAGGDVFSQNRE